MHTGETILILALVIGPGLIGYLRGKKSGYGNGYIAGCEYGYVCGYKDGVEAEKTNTPDGTEHLRDKLLQEYLNPKPDVRKTIANIYNPKG